MAAKYRDGGGPGWHDGGIEPVKKAAGNNLRHIEAGKKLYITGKGRCNLTNARPINEFFDKIPVNPRFLYSAFHQFSNEDLMEFFVARGVPLAVEQGQRVFPESGKSSDILRALEKELAARRVRVLLGCGVADVQIIGGRLVAFTDTHGHTHAARRVIASGALHTRHRLDGDGYAGPSGRTHHIPGAGAGARRGAEPWVPSLMG